MILFLLTQLCVIQNTYVNYDSIDLKDMQKMSIIRGNYKDVLEEEKGALIINANELIFIGGQDNSSPQRALAYYLISGGYTCIAQNQSLIIKLFQNYQLNRIRFRLYDIINNPIRTYNMQIFIYGPQINNKSCVFDSLAATSVQTISFDDTFISKIEFYNRGGNSIDQWLFLIKIQAYYSF